MRSVSTVVIGENFIDGVSGDAGEYRVGALVIGEADQPEGQCPAAPSGPGRVIDR
jgi:hypothetical protein